MPKRDDLFVDTSGWSCYLNNEERFHSIITAFVANALKKHQRLITTNYVIAELVALLSSRYPLPRSQVITNSAQDAPVIHAGDEWAYLSGWLGRDYLA